MVGLPKWGNKESRAAEHERKQREKQEKKERAAVKAKEAEKTTEGGYKPAPEEDVLGWGHRGESSPHQ
ncbi:MULTISPECIES: hypothetical protein [Streptomyces]|uniref:Uncharacterized protein n=3 Tax=Streptomyces TaxID=1883 RepID=A0A3S9PBY0_STRLT|nr:hypothetical protein [Streptomyces luteoverticillatus]AZQ69889.1 hypothetical protein EKH77_00445 [Streptomyces luteoverticillatus]